MIVMGVDPGLSGGGCVLSGGVSGNGKIVDLHKFTTEVEFIEWVARWSGEVSAIYLELVHSMPQQGVKSTFTFGSNFGFERGVLKSLGDCQFNLVSPQKWQSPLHLPKGVTKTQHKNDLKDKAKEFWPAQKWTHALADGALIARHGLRKELNIRERPPKKSGPPNAKDISNRILK